LRSERHGETGSWLHPSQWGFAFGLVKGLGSNEYIAGKAHLLQCLWLSVELAQKHTAYMGARGTSHVVACEIDDTLCSWSLQHARDALGGRYGMRDTRNLLVMAQGAVSLRFR
ncbi:hypothetical protein MBANPS3_012642, partial [Mucor bainieri]